MNFNYNDDIHEFVENVFSYNFIRTLSNRVTCHDRHETDNWCYLWYVKVRKKNIFILSSLQKLVTFANNSHLRFTIIDNFYASRVDSDPNFLWHYKLGLICKEF